MRPEVDMTQREGRRRDARPLWNRPSDICVTLVCPEASRILTGSKSHNYLLWLTSAMWLSSNLWLIATSMTGFSGRQARHS
jgi:hypothetical protein